MILFAARAAWRINVSNYLLQNRPDIQFSFGCHKFCYKFIIKVCKIQSLLIIHRYYYLKSTLKNFCF